MEADEENAEPVKESSPASKVPGDGDIAADDQAELLNVLGNVNGYNNVDLMPKINNTLFKHPQAEHDPERTTAVASGLSDLRVDICQFPPLPTPRYNTKRQESSVGISLVILLSLTLIGIVHGISLTAIGGIEKHSAVWWTFFSLIYAEVGISMICLGGLLWTDPGVVHRSTENSFPIPVQCEAWIQAHAQQGKPDSCVEPPTPPTEYYIASAEPNTPGDTYCVRCLVWRRFEHSTKYFHCSICQRCVADFDHHCSVFGRCIAGTWWKGNYIYFVAIIAMGGVGYLTSVVSLLWSLSLRYKPQIAIPVCLFILWFTTGIVMGKLCTGACFWCRACAIACTNQIRKYLKT